MVIGDGQGRTRAGVVGAGHMGQYHILALAELWDVDLVAICDTDAERASSVAAQYSLRAVPTHHELAGLVDIATSPSPLIGTSTWREICWRPASTCSSRSR